MGVVLFAIRSLFPRGRLYLNRFGDSIRGGIADAIEDLKKEAGGSVVWDDGHDTPYDGTLPEIPNNPAGTVYVQSDWATADGWSGINCTITATGGKLVTSNPTNINQYLSRAFTGVPGKTVKVKIRKLTGSATTAAFNGLLGVFTEISYNGQSEAIFSFTATQNGTLLVYPGFSGRSASDTYEIDWVYIGDGSYAPLKRSGGLLSESWPGTAVDSLPAWHDTLGVAYDPSERSIAEQQTMLAAMETSVGGATLGKLQAQFDKEFDGRIVVSELTIVGNTGAVICGMARCGVGSSIRYSLGYGISGTIYSETEASRVTSILARYAPAHLNVISTLTDFSATGIARCGLARTGIARVGIAS